MEYVYLLFAVEILLFFFAFFASSQDIMAPSVVMCGMFLISTVAAILLGSNFHVKYGFDSFAILSVGIFTFVLSEIVFRWIFQIKITAVKKERIISELQTKPFTVVPVQKWMITALVIYDAILMIWYTRTMIAVYGGIGGVVRSVSVQTTYVDFSESVINPIRLALLKVVEISGYIAAFILCQEIVAKEKRWSTIQLLIIIAMSQWPSVVGAARGSILRFIVAILIEYYILWHQKNGWHRNLSWKYLRIGMVCLLAGIPLFYYSLKWMGRAVTSTLSEHTLSYLGQSIWLFDNFVKQPTKPIIFGEESLTGIHRFIKRFLKIDQFIRNDNLETRFFAPGYAGNVYTFFRRPLHDFGFIGMIIFTILVSFLFSSIYYGKIKWKRRNIHTDCWSIIYGYLFYWIVVSSMLQYSSLYLTTGTIVTIIGFILGYRLMIGVKVTFDHHRRSR